MILAYVGELALRVITGRRVHDKLRVDLQISEGPVQRDRDKGHIGHTIGRVAYGLSECSDGEPPRSDRYPRFHIHPKVRDCRRDGVVRAENGRGERVGKTDSLEVNVCVNATCKQTAERKRAITEEISFVKIKASPTATPGLLGVMLRSEE